MKAESAIDPQTYFRNNLFRDQLWIDDLTNTDQPVENATIAFEVSILANPPRQMDLKVSHAPNRESKQLNYTTLLHLGPLYAVFSAQDMTGKQMTIDRNANGTFYLTII